MKKYIIIAGVNGAGKSTLFHTFEYLKNMPRVNMDDEVRAIGSWKNEKDVFYGGKNATSLLNSLIKGDETFNQETTLCGRSILSNIEKAKRNGFFVEIHYIGLATIQLAKERVCDRVKKGGHGIPDSDIERRFQESFSQMKSLLSKVDRAIFYDNTSELRRFAVYESGELKQESFSLPAWYIHFIK